jgi:hypothetical protein
MTLARSFAAAILGLAMIQVASAQTGTGAAPVTPGSTSGTTGSTSAAPNPAPGATQPSSGQTQPESLPQELRQKLADAGYTDIQIVAQSFVVSAKTKDRNPVLMRISPNEMTVLTEAPADRTNAQANSPATTGSTGTAGQATGDRFSHPAGLPQGSGSQK